MKTINNIQNIGLSELFVELLNNKNEEIYFCEIDAYNHLKTISNNFDLFSLSMIYIDLFAFISFELTFLINGDSWSLGTVNDIAYDSDFLNINSESLNDITDENVITETILRVNKLREINIGVEIVELNVYNYLMNYTNIFREIISRNEIDISMFEGNPFIKSVREHKKSVLFFKDLFKKEYQSNEIQSKFSQWLIRERYLNHSNEIICDHTKFARLYYLLREEGITKPIPNKTNVMRTYFGNFGVKVVESYDPENDAPQVVRKTVTGESAETHEMLGMTTKEKDTLLNIFKPN